MLWIKSLHIIFMVTWFAGLFYLPRIFVYHAMSESAEEQKTFKTMERKLMVMTHIGGALTIIFGFWLLIVWLAPFMAQTWMQLKLLLVLLLGVYHFWCQQLVRTFRDDLNKRSHRWYRLFNEIPVLFLFVIVILVVVKPQF